MCRRVTQLRACCPAYAARLRLRLTIFLMQALLGVSDEAAAELQLFSFCAASCLGAPQRAGALNAVSTVDRLECATGACDTDTRRLSSLSPPSLRSYSLSRDTALFTPLGVP